MKLTQTLLDLVVVVLMGYTPALIPIVAIVTVIAVVMISVVT